MVSMSGVVQGRIVDQALPTTVVRVFKVDAHHDIGVATRSDSTELRHSRVRRRRRVLSKGPR